MADEARSRGLFLNGSDLGVGFSRLRVAGRLLRGNGVRFEIDEVHQCLADGRTESSVVPLDESSALGTTLDAMRAELGVVYPGERAARVAPEPPARTPDPPVAGRGRSGPRLCRPGLVT